VTLSVTSQLNLLQ